MSEWERDVVRCTECSLVWDDLDPEKERCACGGGVTPVPLTDEYWRIGDSET